MNVDNLRIGDINRSNSESLSVGGKGINVSKILNSLNIKTTVCGFTAGPIGKTIQEQISKLDLKSIWVKTQGCSRINVKINCQKETAINGRGCFALLEDLEKLCNQIDSYENSYIVLSGSLCNGLTSNSYAYIMSKLKGKFFVDAESDLLLKSLPHKPFLIKPNQLELGQIFNCKIDTFDKAIEYGRKLCFEGAENCVVSMGKEGSVWITQKEAFVVKANNTEFKSTVGAGDTLLAGIIRGVIFKLSPKDCLTEATGLVESYFL